MEQNGTSVRFWKNLMRFGTVTSQLNYHVTTVCADKGKGGICEFHIDRSYEWSRNENHLCLDNCESFWSVAFSFTVQIFKVKDTAM